MSDELKAPNLIVMSHQPTRFEDAWRLLTRLKESGDFPQLDASIDEAIKHLHTRGLPDPQSYSLEEIKAENTKDGCLLWCLLLGVILKSEQ